MASIQARKTREGKQRFTVTVRLRIGEESFAESRTFSTRAMATAWARQREDDIKRDPAGSGVAKRISIKALIEQYLAQTGTTVGRSKGQHLRLLTTYPLADADAVTVTAARLVEHVRERRAGGGGG